MATNTTEKVIKLTIDGKEATVDINRFKKAVKEVLAETKKIEKTNLGNFRKQINDLTDSFKSGEIGLKGFMQGIIGVGKALMTTFVTNPILLSITAIVGAITGLVAMLKTFTPVVEKVQQKWAGLTAGFDTFKNSVLGWITGNKSFKESFTRLGESMRDAAAAARGLKATEQDLEDQQILLELSNANLQNQIDRLLLQSRDRTKTEKERLKAIDDAMKLEQQRFEQTKKVNDDEVRMAEKALAIKLGITEEELRNIGVAGAMKKNGAQVNADKEIDILKQAYLKRASIEGQNIQLAEKTQNRRNQIIEASESGIEKTKQKEKELWDEIKKNEKDARDIMLENEKEFNDAMDAAFNEMMNREAKGADEKIESEKRVSDAKQQIAEEEANKALEKIEQDKEDAADFEEWKKQTQIESARTSLEAIATLDQAFTNVALNRQQQLLRDKKITQEQYDKAVSKIQAESAKREKAYAVASTIIDTAAAIMGIWKDVPKKDYGVMATILSVATGLLGAAQISKIISTPVDGTMSGGGGSIPTGAPAGGGTSPNTSFTFSPSSTTPQLQPVRTYVISKDVQTQQQLDRQVVANGTI